MTTELNETVPETISTKFGKTEELQLVTKEESTAIPKDESTKETGKGLTRVTTEAQKTDIQQQNTNTGTLALSKKWGIMQTLLACTNIIVFTVLTL